MEKRFFYHTEELINAHPDFLSRTSPSLDARLEIAAAAAPELAALAAAKAIADWGRPAGDISHLVVSTNSGAHAPGVDIRLISLLGLRPGVFRTMLHLNGCGAGSASLRLAKDLAENNRGARVLVVCVELTITCFRGPDEEDCFDSLISPASFGDGAGAVIVGAGPEHPAERPLFEMVTVSQAVIPRTEHTLNMRLGNSGVDGNILFAELSSLSADNIEQCLLDALGPLGIPVEWNDLFWVVHPGNRAILDNTDRVLRLEPEKLAASRTVLREYGNMLGATVIFFFFERATVIFVLDEQRRRMEEEGVGENKWGVMVGFGPGFSVETTVLRATGNLKKTVPL
jgi:predicted naringenin-chalcone synthase